MDYSIPINEPITLVGFAEGYCDMVEQYISEEENGVPIYKSEKHALETVKVIRHLIKNNDLDTLKSVMAVIVERLWLSYIYY